MGTSKSANSPATAKKDEDPDKQIGPLAQHEAQNLLEYLWNTISVYHCLQIQIQVPR